jgi:hypothetical protein
MHTLFDKNYNILSIIVFYIINTSQIAHKFSYMPLYQRYLTILHFSYPYYISLLVYIPSPFTFILYS